ncbi:MAG: hypothetical protein LBP94_00560 [Zoogloeaceae bacterium]|jgi:hypothetical protein|nr:hypothetical protein [Zoogloeaceae bacterium]
MPLTLLVPALLWPREILRDTTFDLPLPSLGRLLGRARLRPLTGEDGWLAETFGITAPLPAAALRLLGDGSQPDNHNWICLDPVHLRLREWALIADAPTALALNAEEDAALREAIAPLFSDFGELLATAAGRWHLRLAQPARIETKPLPAAVGRAVDPALPSGADGAEWRRRLAEAQTLLHTHEVNQRRIEVGHITVNHLWPWGQGRLPDGARRAFDRVLTDDPVLRGLAMLAGCEVAALPARHIPQSGKTLVKLGHLSAASIAHDAMAWREALAQLEAGWFAPALAGAAGGVARQLTLVADGERAFEATATSLSLRRFWRPAKNLADIEP